MNPHSIVVQQAAGRPQQLILLFHGVGATPQGLVPLGQRLAAAFPAATVVSVAAPHPSDLSSGYQWFSVQGITEANRPGRVAAAMPAFLAEVQGWQQAQDATAAVTALVGFSQGAIMALESTHSQPAPAGRVVAIAGRFATLPTEPASHTTLHLLHGKGDAVIPYRHTVEAVQHLLGIGADATADVVPFVGHEIHPDIADLVVERLQGHIPKRLWDEALRASPVQPKQAKDR
ncbi:MAG TPA: esterase [Burkholderiaceae bacterium]|nr:esterase [Burkholderiaceae bacterium]